MHVRVINFGSNWWEMHSHALDDSLCFRRNAAWFNSAALRCGRRIRYFAAYSGQIRFNLTSGFNPEFPARALGRTYLCSGPNQYGGKAHLLFVRLVAEAAPDAWLCDAEFWRSRRDRVHKTRLAIGRSAADLDQFARRKIRSNAALWRYRLGPERPGTMDYRQRWAASRAR